MKEKRLRKILIFLSTLLITSILFIIYRTSPASGYEISIYNAYPWYFWLLMILTIIIGEMGILSSVWDREKYWKIGFGTIMIVNTLLLFLPYFRGYGIYGKGDVLTHVGHIINILETNTIPSNLIYPALHTLSAIINFVTGLSPHILTIILPLIFTLFYVLGMYLLIRNLFENEKEVLLTLVFISVLIFRQENLMLATSVQAFFFTPLILIPLVKYTKREQGQLKSFFIFIILSISLIFYHPLVSLLFIILLIIYKFSISFSKKLNFHKGKKNIHFSNDSFGIIFTSILIIWNIWYFNFKSIIYSFKQTFFWFLYGVGETDYETYTETISRESPQLLDLLELGFFKFGQYVLLTFLSIGLIIYLFKRRYLDNWEFGLNYYYVFFIGIFLIFTPLTILYFFSNLPGGFTRIGRFVLFSSPIVIGISLYHIHEKVSNNHLLEIIIIIFVIFLVLVSVLNTYRSPITRSRNSQVTNMELKGTDWIINQRNETYNIEERGFSQKRFIYGLHGITEGIRFNDTQPPTHFGYEKNNTLGKSYESNVYLIITREGIISYQILFPDYEEQWRFTPRDFEKVETDPTVNRIYTNGEFTSYYVEGD